MSETVIFPSWTNACDITRSEIDRLIHLAKRSAEQRARICLHRTHSDPVQEMIIAMTPRSYVRPHRQVGFEKSYILLAGSLTFHSFDACGKHLHSRCLSRDGIIATRFDAGQWHSAQTNAPDVAVYIETLRGPFSQANTQWADWAPEAQNATAVAEFLAGIACRSTAVAEEIGHG